MKTGWRIVSGLHFWHRSCLGTLLDGDFRRCDAGRGQHPSGQAGGGGFPLVAGWLIVEVGLSAGALLILVQWITYPELFIRHRDLVGEHGLGD